MPHIVLEYSENIPKPSEPELFLLKLHRALAASGPFELTKIKSRMVKQKRFCVAGGGEDQAFLHLELAILDGRSVEERKAASNALLSCLIEEYGPLLENLNCSITVEVRELESASYTKAVQGILHE